MKWVLVFVANEPYVGRAFQSISSARTIGEWRDDIILMGPESLLQLLPFQQSLTQYEVQFVAIPFCPVNSVQPFWDQHKTHENYDYIKTHPYIYQKFFAFHTMFKAWDVVFYMDSGCVIQGPLERMKTMCTPRNFLYAHSDSYPFYTYRSLDCQFRFELADASIKQELESRHNLDIDYFQSTLMIYNTKILEDSTIKRLFELAEKYPMSVRMDQGILNLYWTCERKLWRQMPLQDEVGFLYNFLELKGCKTKDYLILKYPRWVQ
jgi:hypothetical protein